MIVIHGKKTILNQCKLTTHLLVFYWHGYHPSDGILVIDTKWLWCVTTNYEHLWHWLSLLNIFKNFKKLHIHISTLSHDGWGGLNSKCSLSPQHSSILPKLTLRTCFLFHHSISKIMPEFFKRWKRNMQFSLWVW